MRTTLNVDRKLLEEASEILGEKSLSAAVNMALSEFVRRHELRQLRSLLGTGLLIDDGQEFEKKELRQHEERLVDPLR